MKTSMPTLILALLTSLLLLSGCDYGSKKAFADSIRAAGHFEKK